MDSTTNILIIAVTVGIIIFVAIWALPSNAVSADVSLKKLDDSAATSAQPQDATAPAMGDTSSQPEPKQAPKAIAKTRSTARARPASRKNATPLATPVEAPTAKQAAPKKTAPKKTTPAPMTAIGVPGAAGPADSLLQIKGLGPKLNTLLDGLGITRFDQIAAWNADDVSKVDEHLGTFKGRIDRDSWIEQAGLLAKGAIAEFEAKFGKLDSENK